MSVRIAIAGSHRVGKSALVDELAAALPGYATVDEPYVAMAEDGHEFADPPTREDFEAQLGHALASLAEAAPRALFDRSPVDLLAYLTEHDEADDDDADAWLPRVRAAVETLDLIVFVPIEAPDRIAAAGQDDHPAWRRRVDARLRALLVEGEIGADVEVLEVHGSVARRAQAVLARVRPPRPPAP